MDTEQDKPETRTVLLTRINISDKVVFGMGLVPRFQYDPLEFDGDGKVMIRNKYGEKAWYETGLFREKKVPISDNS